MTNNKQQTAVEFYLDKIFDIIGDAILDKLSIEQINKIHDLSLQAKEMEKEQAINLYYEYERYVMMNQSDEMITESSVMTFGQFYKQTYGGGEQ
jgi:hypothetical protein